ncbi:MAG: family N-acetyltransferase [Cyanobacteria bacterium RYN_339]|nr:family N-acetyltransferase [Cyanobacteria bacterium RYN_339]
MAPAIQLIPTRESDLDFVTSAEAAAENSAFVSVQPRSEHVAYLRHPDVAHFIVHADHTARPAGYVIVAGLQRDDRVLEIKRIVITEKGLGIGHATLQAVKRYAFETHGAHRLWLDVMETNARARHLYAAEGFKEDGTVREGDDLLIIMTFEMLQAVKES